MDHRYNRHNRRKYSLKVHRKPRLMAINSQGLLPPPEGSGRSPKQTKGFIYELFLNKGDVCIFLHNVP